MSHNNQWYNGQYPQNSTFQRVQDPNYQNSATNNPQNGHRLLAVYPPASATPTHHVSRHMGSITLTAAPTFPQPDFYTHDGNAQGNPPPYSEYDHQLHYLASNEVSVNDSGYWENTRNEAVKLLSEPIEPSYQYRDSTQWLNPMPQSTYQTSPFAQSIFQRTMPGMAYPTPPPGISPSSSSLAHALGPVPTPSQPQFRQEPPPQRVYHPQESRLFYEDFLERKARQMNQYALSAAPLQPTAYSPTKLYASPSRTSHAYPSAIPGSETTPTQMTTPYPPSDPAPTHRNASQSPVRPQNHAVYSVGTSSNTFPRSTQPSYVAPPTTVESPSRLPHPAMPRSPARPHTPPSKPSHPESSPDPLALRSGGAVRTMSSVAVTPRKRKLFVEIQTPSVKRLHSMKSLSSSSLAEKPSTPTKTPQSTQNSVPVTPSSSASSISKMSQTSTNSTPTARRINLAYVSLPARPYLTPQSNRRLDSDDLGGYGEPSSPTKRSVNDSVKSSARRTGDRDERVPLEKLTSLIEDIFEAEDSLPPEVEPNDLNHDFFSPLSSDCSRPLLAPAIIRKLIKYIGYVARPTKRLRQATAGVMGTPRGKGRVGDVDMQQLSRLLKILERSVRAGEDLDPFPHVPASHLPASSKASPKKASTKKGGKTRKTDRRSRSITPKEGDDAGADDDDDRPALTEADFDKFSNLLDTARDSILAADCCIALLGSDRLPKQLYSEELITACLGAIKNQLTKVLYPFVEAYVETGITMNANPLLQSLVKASNSSSSEHRQQFGELFQALSAVLPRINNLVSAELIAMSDKIIVSTVYIAIGPFFVVDADTGKKDNAVIKILGKSAMRGLRLDALSLIRSVFANHESQRSWIIEEILTSLIKLNDTKQKAGQFRLRDGRSIRTVSALLLQLVQTSAHDVRIEAKRIEQLRKNKLALKRQESINESQGQPIQPEPFLDEIDQEAIRLYARGLESATNAARTIILFLTQRSGKGKATKNSNEAEYRIIFDNLIEDVLVVLFWPEWPAASLVLSVASKFMVSSLDDVKTNSQTDTNAAKQMALDHLGVIAAKIRTSVLKFQRENNPNPATRFLKPLDDIVSNLGVKYLNKFLDAHRDVATHLCKRSSADQAYDSARELTAAALCQEVSSALRDVAGWIEHPEADDNLNIKDPGKLLQFGQRLKTALVEVWKDPATDVFNVGSQEEVERTDTLSEEIGTIQSLRNSFNPILSVILAALDAPAIFMRTKALKALGQIVTSDSAILSAPNVRRGIESHLLDSSPAVRDAAVELIGRYMIDSPKVAVDYYQKIADRMADTGLSVRKRVIKLLKGFYSVSEDTDCKIDVATRLILRMLDEDESVKDLAIKSIEELWFPPLPLQSALKNRTATTSEHLDKTTLLSKVSVIMGTAANFKDRQSPLEDILHKIMADKEGSEKSSLHARYGEICETLIDGLVDASDLPGFTVTNCVRTIYLLASAYPSVLSGANASTLLPYLKNASTVEELTTSDYLLKIFRVTIPHMPKTAAKFGHELQATLQPMIIKPSGGGGVQIMQETVGCMCTVVQHLTHDFVRLINLMKSCNARLQQLINRPSKQELGQNEIRAIVVLILIVALLTENCNFDDLRKERQNLAADLDSISQGSITEYIYKTLLTLYERYDNSTLRSRVLQCLGFLFRAQPTLMTMERSASIMDQIFASPEEEGKGRLLKIIQDFLMSEAEKHTALEKDSSKHKSKPADVNMDELVGNTDGFADSGVSSAIVQRYLSHVLEAALCQNVQIQSVAIDVLTFTVKQGLAHPLQSFPVIIALETSPVNNIGNRASALHAILQGKHSSLINARYTDSVRTSFTYQKRIVTGPVQGFRLQPTPLALLQRWYSHIREKRAVRQDFLKSLVKIFQERESLESSQDDVNYCRYVAENFATFEYKTQEEVLTVIKFLTSTLSTTGMQLLEILSPSHLLTYLHGPLRRQQENMSSDDKQDDDAMDVVSPPREQPEKREAKQYDEPALMRTSAIVAMVMLLKAHLKVLYSLSEDKCSKFVVGKKSAIGDKQAVKRNDNAISWKRLPFATIPLLTTEDANAQKTTFLEIWNEDGVVAEPDDEEFS